MSFAEPPPGIDGTTLRHDTGCGAFVVVGAVVVEVVVVGWVVVAAGFDVVGGRVVGAKVVDVVVEAVGAVELLELIGPVVGEVPGAEVEGSSARSVFTETLVATSEEAPFSDVAVKYTATAAPMQSRAMPVRGPRARRMRSWLPFIAVSPSGAGRNSPEGWPFGRIGPAQRVSAHEHHPDLHHPIHQSGRQRDRDLQRLRVRQQACLVGS